MKRRELDKYEKAIFDIIKKHPWCTIYDIRTVQGYLAVHSILAFLLRRQEIKRRKFNKEDFYRYALPTRRKLVKAASVLTPIQADIVQVLKAHPDLNGWEIRKLIGGQRSVGCSLDNLISRKIIRKNWREDDLWPIYFLL